MSDSSKPTLVYFNLRGRGDVIRLALSQTGVDWAEESIDYAVMKQGGPDFPFAQAPAFHHNGLRVVQMDAILRYIGREWGMYGDSNVESTQIDMIMCGVESLRAEYVNLCYKEKFSEEGVKAYKATHLDAAGLATRNNGAHMQYLEDILGRSDSFVATGFSVGNKLSIADLHLFDLVHLHLRPACSPAEMQAFPNLLRLHNNVAALPAIKAFLESDRRPSAVNGNNMG
eukprot:CAMPEP_0114430280 /NCGR_PEP_ID=MMETSP0103-20121206/9955_1 /TAXON_ID=37642 ORGANISM="Paraphysomonas imperforata, Strain PA2" /NCGR_SAMPLE_ID=MMETSP0103 /ASSEMBLY_ACC=CAM_ASM_000201 /LENGTH=227 /DNA_ID=CAMNT_0001599713 /DNA_START=34 /DNA_END=717 /DNA_ORIENTATION=-